MKIITALLYLVLIILSGCGFKAGLENPIADDSVASPEQIITPAVIDPQHVVDYFNILKTVEPSLENYNLVKNAADNNWKCYDAEEPTREYASVIDLQNGFLRIEDDGTGGGNLYTELAIFKKSNRQYIIAFNQYAKSPGLYSEELNNPQLDFYRFDKKMIRITDSVFTPIKADQLDPSGCFNQLYYSLPQQGTSIVAKLYTMRCSQCSNLENLKTNIDAEQFQNLQSMCENCCNQYTKEISIPFNKDSGTFILKK